MHSILDFVVHQGVAVCTRGVPHSPYASMYAALVCGVDLPSGHDKALFLDTGLVHILVVSGAHLVFVERLLAFTGDRTRLVILLAYCWLTGFGAPVARAFARRLCASGLEGWGWTSLQIEAAASALILVCVPEWLLSRSFLMSWLCALALQAPLPWPRWRAFNVSLKCFAFLYPFAPSSPLAVGWNCLLGPFIGEILFPACLLAFALPWTVPLTDELWRGLLWLLETGPRAPARMMFWPATWLWWLPLSAHVLLLWGEWKWRRHSAFACPS